MQFVLCSLGPRMTLHFYQFQICQQRLGNKYGITIFGKIVHHAIGMDFKGLTCQPHEFKLSLLRVYVYNFLKKEERNKVK